MNGELELGRAQSGGKDSEIVVFMTRRESVCSECGVELFPGSMLRVENEKALCLDCADLGHLEFLPRGDTAVTRRTTKHSPLRAVVVQWARARKRYERQGILADPQAILRARDECEADADIRARRRAVAAEGREVQDLEFIRDFSTAVRAAFPHCPPGEEEAIARHACRKHSGRVGRSAAAKELAPDAIRLAVIAHIRHVHTEYDRLLGMFGDRQLARHEIRDQVQTVLGKWE